MYFLNLGIHTFHRRACRIIYTSFQFAIYVLLGVQITLVKYIIRKCENMKVIIKIFILGIFTQSVKLTTASSNEQESRDNNSRKIVHKNYSGGNFEHDNDLLEVPEDYFRDPELSKLEHIHFDNNTFTNLPVKLFKVLNNIKNITICNDNLSTLPEGLFQGLPNLIFISFEVNNLTTIPKKLFFDQKKLLYLTIKHNHLNNLDDELFAHTFALKELDLSYNQLVNISG